MTQSPLKKKNAKNQNKRKVRSSLLTWFYIQLFDCTSNSFLDSFFPLMQHLSDFNGTWWLRCLSVYSWKQYDKFNFQSILANWRNSRYYNVRRLKVCFSLWSLFSSWFGLAAREKDIGSMLSEAVLRVACSEIWLSCAGMHAFEFWWLWLALQQYREIKNDNHEAQSLNCAWYGKVLIWYLDRCPKQCWREHLLNRRSNRFSISSNT